MASELNIDLTQLPQDIRDKLAELELELSEGKGNFLAKFYGLILYSCRDTICSSNA